MCSCCWVLHIKASTVQDPFPHAVVGFPMDVNENMDTLVALISLIHKLGRPSEIIIHMAGKSTLKCHMLINA